jgi:hypothetical protein
VLFGGYPEKAEDIKSENLKLLMTANEKRNRSGFHELQSKACGLKKMRSTYLRNSYTKSSEKMTLPRTRTYFGGFSSGGNVALLVGDYPNLSRIPKWHQKEFSW